MSASILENKHVRERALSISTEQYHRLWEAGIIGERTELIAGVIVEKMTKSPLHSLIVQRLFDWLHTLLPENSFLRMEQPLTLADSEPEPDISLVRGNREDYANRHPDTALLAIEVAVSTQELDRAKASIYAAANIPEYWLILPAEKKIEVYREPREGQYARCEVIVSDQELSLEGMRTLRVNLRDLFA